MVLMSDKTLQWHVEAVLANHCRNAENDSTKRNFSVASVCVFFVVVFFCRLLTSYGGQKTKTEDCGRYSISLLSFFKVL